MAELIHMESEHPWDDDRLYHITRISPASGIWSNAYVGAIRPDGQLVLVFQGEADTDGNADEVEVMLPSSIANQLRKDIRRSLHAVH